MPIKKFGFSDSVACFIQQAAQRNPLLFYFYFVNLVRIVNFKIG